MSKNSDEHTKEKSKILKFRKKRHLNIGVVIFGVIFIYLVVTIFMYMIKPKVTSYEVREGSLIKDYFYTGIAVRSEAVVTSESSGYVNYYVADGNKVRVGSTVYTLSSAALDFGDGSEENTDSSAASGLSEMERYEIALQIQEFNHDFNESYYSDVYTLKNNITNELNQKESRKRLDILSAMIEQNAVAGISSYKAPGDGVIVYYTDGMENLSPENVTKKHFDRTSYDKTTFSNNTQVSAGDTVYKLVTADEWQLLIEISEETKKVLEGRETLDVTLKKDGKVLCADVEVSEKDGSFILCLSFQNSMIRYINERFLDVDLMIENQEGLKIPKTAVVEKECFVIPKRYLTQGGDKSGYGVMLLGEDETEMPVFKAVTILYSDDEIVYLSMDEFSEGDRIQEVSASEVDRETAANSVAASDNESGSQEVHIEPDVHSISVKKILKGVYRINEGFAVFKAIEILAESDDYYIIEEENIYSISNYDRIALYSSSIQENEFLF